MGHDGWDKSPSVDVAHLRRSTLLLALMHTACYNPITIYSLNGLTTDSQFGEITSSHAPRLNWQGVAN